MMPVHYCNWKGGFMAIKVNLGKKAIPTKKASTNWLNKDIQLFGSSLNDKKKERFFHSLSILINERITISQTLETIIAEQESEKDKILYQSIYDDLVAGLGFHQALQKSGKFTNYDFYSVKIGEETGKLGRVLKDIHQFYSKRLEQKRKLLAALSYPVVVLLVAFVTVVFMLSVIVPLFSDIFNRFDGELPLLTKYIVSCSDFIKNELSLIILGIALLGIALFFLFKQAWFQRWSDVFLLKLPFVGDLVHKIYLSRFCHNMALLNSAKVPLIEALKLVQKMIPFYPLQELCADMQNGLFKGISLYQSMEGKSIVPPKVISMVKIGEEVNQLDVMFEKLANIYEDELNYKMQVINNVIEPLLIVFLGIIVGVILIGMYLPIFKLSTEIF